MSDNLENYAAADQVSRGFFWASAVGLLVLICDGLLLAFARIAPQYGVAQEVSQFLFWRGRPVHLQMLIFAWLSMALMGAMYYVVPRMVKTDLRSLFLGRLHLVLQVLGSAAILVSLHYGYTEGREYLEPVMPLDIAVVGIWVLFAGNIFATVLRSRTDQVSYGLKFILVSILYLGLNFVMANFIPLNGVKDDVMVYTFAHNEVNGWFMFGLMGLMYWTLPRLAGVDEKNAFSPALSNWHFGLLMVLVPPSVLHHFLYDSTPIIGFWKQVGSWTSVAMLIPTAIWAYMAFRLLAKRRVSGPAWGFYMSAMVFYVANCVQGAGQSLLPANEAVHQTQWVVGHAHLALVGWISMGVFGVIYQLLPGLSRAERTGRLHLIVANVGFLGMWLSLTAAGIIQALNPRLPHGEIEAMIAPFLVGRAAFGVLFSAGAVIFAYNIVVYCRERRGLVVVKDTRKKQVA